MSLAAVRLPRRGQAGLAAMLCLCLASTLATGQPASELILPPSAEVSEPAQRSAPADQPSPGPPAGQSEADASAARGAASAARIAPAAPDRPLPMEEVIVIDESEWRLPDLGSAWRAAEAAKPDTGRIQLSFLPLYDPENSDPVPDIFERNDALHRMQMIEVIRVRFGGRSEE